MIELQTPQQAAKWLRQSVTGALRSDSRKVGVKGISHHAGVSLEVGQAGHALRRLQTSPGLTALGLDQTGGCTLRQGRWYKTAYIHRRSWPGNETVARAHLAAVRAQGARDTLTQPLRCLLWLSLIHI